VKIGINRYDVKFIYGVSKSECCAAVRGTTIRGTAGVRIATGTSVTTGTTTLGFGLLSLPPALFCVRVDGWEFIEHTKEESRLTPVRLLTISKNQTESDSLVGSKVEELFGSSNFITLITSGLPH